MFALHLPLASHHNDGENHPVMHPWGPAPPILEPLLCTSLCSLGHKVNLLS